MMTTTMTEDTELCSKPLILHVPNLNFDHGTRYPDSVFSFFHTHDSLVPWRSHPLLLIIFPFLLMLYNLFS